ncbi:MAG: S1 RNA-binding domain-containing protein [Clostridiales bacterium]|nr:S1 RNA-binding domain-containing protein [Clostridiales bacterium]
MDITVGQIVDGKITGITKFGAFVDLGQGVTGLIRISEIADIYVKDINDFLKEKDPVKAKVISIDDNGKIALSLKQAKAKSLHRNPPSPATFEDKLAKFMKDSNEKLVALKRHQEGKKGR